ncbi:hypothetical protein [Aquimarina sediminis]|uniref:hypothetical protein n=1 Tax=Aquimarina sediminis TaxID=2070536 RepID=UPI000CA07D34|nr:hypothetical protein [Aquimarina sediminis]
MGKYSNSEWYLKLSKEYLEKHGDVPPPWVYCPTCHPYSICWRMGGGETHIMVLSEWLDQKKLTFNQRVAYLKRYPAPARWYQWIVKFLWDLAPEESDFALYFGKLEKLGFPNVSNFKEDFDREDLE